MGNDWEVWYTKPRTDNQNGSHLVILPLHQDDAAGLFIQDTDSKNEGKEVEFEVIDDRQICNCRCHEDSNIIHFAACCNDGYKTDHVNYYAKLIL